MSNDQLFQLQQMIESGMSSQLIDKFVKTHSPNLIESAKDIRIELASIAHLTHMLEHANDSFILLNACPILCALYEHDQHCPVPRNYFFELGSLGQLPMALKYLRATKFNREKILDRIGYLDAILHEGAEARIADYHMRHLDPLVEKAKEMASGRNKNTTQRKVEFFNTRGCIICGENPVKLMSSTIAGETANAIQFKLCTTHADEALASESIINYLADKWNMPRLLQVEPLELRSDVDYFNEAKEIIEQKLTCNIVKVSVDSRTITASRRESGMVVIIRLQSYVKPGYAYMVNHPEGAPAARIDAAPDHPDADYFPDHKHMSLPRDNSKVAPSFTTGHIRLDWPAILNEILRVESSLKRSG